MPNPNLESLIASWLDGRISASDSELLQQQLLDSSDARAMFREQTKLDASLYVLARGGVNVENKNTVVARPHAGIQDSLAWRKGEGKGKGMVWVLLAVAATTLVMVGVIAYQLGRADTNTGGLAEPFVYVKRSETATEQTISGHATLRRVAGIQWSSGDDAIREGDILPAGVFQFDNGVAEIDFFCGATVVVEGPAKMIVESDWSFRLLAGRLRANVPPAARGFVIKAADSEILDLGTEFVLQVGPDNVQVEVVDGEIELRGGNHDGKHLVTGEGQSLIGDNDEQPSLNDLSTIVDVQRRHEHEQKKRFDEWEVFSQQIRTDNRLIAYYPFAGIQADRSVPNAAATGEDRDGKIVGLVNQTDGRFGSESASLSFGRPGTRVRVQVDGEFKAFTFAGWVKVDGLDHLYNSLFMGDGYENGEPHWQIHEDGRMMFSVMVDDTPGTGDGPEPDARLHHIYYTQPIWDVSMSGKWLHLAAVYDPIAGRVNQYVNGKQIRSEEILGRFLVKTLRIGPAEIGNWGQPFRKSTEFAVRNLNGSIDDLAIFDAALNSDEIEKLFRQGRPLGY